MHANLTHFERRDQLFGCTQCIQVRVECNHPFQYASPTVVSFIVIEQLNVWSSYLDT